MSGRYDDILARLQVDYHLLKATLEEGRKAIDKRFEDLRGGYERGLNEFRDAAERAINNLREEMQSGTNRLREETQAGMDNLRAELVLDSTRTEAVIDQLHKTVEEVIQAGNELAARMDAVETRVGALEKKQPPAA